MGVQRVEQMICIIVVEVFYAEIVNAEAKFGALRCVLP
jgi:hypothetical protein